MSRCLDGIRLLVVGILLGLGLTGCAAGGPLPSDDVRQPPAPPALGQPAAARPSAAAARRIVTPSPVPTPHPPLPPVPPRVPPIPPPTITPALLPVTAPTPLPPQDAPAVVPMTLTLAPYDQGGRQFRYARGQGAPFSVRSTGAAIPLPLVLTYTLHLPDQTVLIHTRTLRAKTGVPGGCVANPHEPYCRPNPLGSLQLATEEAFRAVMLPSDGSYWVELTTSAATLQTVPYTFTVDSTQQDAWLPMELAPGIVRTTVEQWGLPAEAISGAPPRELLSATYTRGDAPVEVQLWVHETAEDALDLLTQWRWQNEQRAPAIGTVVQGHSVLQFVDARSGDASWAWVSEAVVVHSAGIADPAARMAVIEALLQRYPSSLRP